MALAENRQELEEAYAQVKTGKSILDPIT